MLLRTIRATTLAIAFSLVVASPTRANYEAGQRALDAGDAAEALVQWRAAADTGDRRAMLALGRLYTQGLGVLQDYAEAHKWFNLASSRGEVGAAAQRDALAEKMTPQQVAMAQERAMEWRPGGGRAQIPETSATPPPAAPPAAADSGPPPPRAIRKAQALLGALGYRPGPADGIWGPRTGEAYRAFLRDVGLPAGDVLTPEALRALRAVAQRNTGRGTTASAGAAGVSPPMTASRPAAVPPDTLHRAARAGDIEGLKRALAAGVDVNARDGRGWTALMYAVDKRFPLLVESLLEADADLSLRAPDGASPLFMAAVHGHSEIIEQLMQAGADITVRGPSGQTAVDAARARYGDVETAQQGKESEAVLTLLAGKTLADTEAQRLAREAEELERLAREREPGRVFRDCPTCPELVVVPAGSYMMGSPSSDGQRKAHEGPVHRVTIAEPFAVGVYEVTFAQWTVCRRDGGCTHRPKPSDVDRLKLSGANQPVVTVSWADAQQYVRWLSRKTGKQYRLLSESEWEYVARAGTTTRYWWGNELGRGRANCYRCGTRWSGKRTAPVGSFRKNAFGLYDVHGNADEWVEDCWHSSYVGAPADGSAWTSGGDCRFRVLRGGSYSGNWLYSMPPGHLRSAARIAYSSGTRGTVSYGFRVARNLD